MAEVAVANLDADSRARGLLKRDTRHPRTQSIEMVEGTQRGIRTLVGFWKDFTSSHGLKTTGRRWKRAAGKDRGNERLSKLDVDAKVVPRELLRPYRAAGSVEAPPSYEESIQDVPPDYTVSKETLSVGLQLSERGRILYRSYLDHGLRCFLSRDKVKDC